MLSWTKELESEMKRCFKCKKKKDISEFYENKRMADGHLNKCIACAKNDSTKHRNNNIEKIRKYDRERGNRQTPEYLREWREKYPNKYKAHNMVNNAIRDGKLFKKPCEICEKDNTRGHHDNYLEPLNVKWLCAACHSQWHKENGEALNP